MTETNLDVALASVNEAALRLERAKEERDEAIRRAHKAGCSFADIAPHALLSKARVQQIAAGR